MNALAAAIFIQLTGPGGQVIDLNVEQIVTVRRPRGEDHFAPGAQCVVTTTDGKFIAVKEPCPAIRDLINGAR